MALTADRTIKRYEHRGKILRLPPNRVWRTYTGGLMLDQMEGLQHPSDSSFPEDWIGSTVRAINPNHNRKDEGLARVVFNGQESLLTDLIESDAEYFLGAAHVNRFGNNPMVLVKYLDSAARLPFQVHPTADFSTKHLQTSSGKTEAYHILSTRPEVADPYIYLGFQRAPSRKELRRIIEEQDIAALESCFDKIPVKPGNTFIVPGGLPHAIGGGVLMVEVMEPTDFVARVEFNVGGSIIPESARFMRRNIDFALDMFRYESFPFETVLTNWSCHPKVIEETSSFRRRSLVDERLTDRFRVSQTLITQAQPWQSRGFTILVLLDGDCEISAGDDCVRLIKNDRIVVPHGLKTLEIRPHGHVSFLECNPPHVNSV